jgi:hypothetical protein
MLGVAVVLNGQLIASSRPAVDISGTIMAPLDPFALRIARTLSFDPQTGTISVAGGGHRLRLILGSRVADLDGAKTTLPQAPYVYEEIPQVPLAAVARALGDNVAFDESAKILAINGGNAGEPLATPAPFDPAAPSAPPAAIFTPRAEPTPRPAITGNPQPRRTPIQAEPSFP